jgi:competence protein ComEA
MKMKPSIKSLGLTRHVLAALALASVLTAASVGSAQLEQGANEAPSTQTAALGVVNLNSATEEELVRLPGIGPAKAQAILHMREQRGPFKKVEDLMQVRGIGRKTFRKLQPMLTLQGRTTLQ